MPIKTESSVFCVLNPEGKPSGTGFLVSKSIGVTCSHNIVTNEEFVFVKFAGQKNSTIARILKGFRRKQEDVAFIQFETLPNNALPLNLGRSSNSTSGNLFHSFGYPKVGDILGVHARGEILGLVLEREIQYLHIRSQELERGFSGAPIWDENLKYVTGMVVSVFKPTEGRKLRDTAFAIPAETLWNIYPELQPTETCPYIGLDAFTDKTAQFFFGRDLITEKLLNVLKGGCRSLVVLGPSGSGKSSVIRAGLLPALRNGRVSESHLWHQITMRPADNPFEQMRSSGLDIFDINQYLERYPNMKKLILFVDQFEEVFTICTEEYRNQFIDFLITSLENSKFILLLSMRDDFYSFFYSKTGKLAETENFKIENIPGAIQPLELKDIIEKPVEMVGLTLEEGLLELIIKDVMHRGEARSSILPLLEFTLTQLWENRNYGCLTHDAYQKIGGVAGSLAQWADDAYSDLPKDLRPLAENLLTSLIHLGDDGQIPDTRMRRTLNEFGNSSEVRKVIEHFVDRRLIVTSRNHVELIHDAVLFEWGQLVKWLNESRSFLTWLQKTSERLKEWSEGKGELLRGRDLAVAQEMWGKQRIGLSQIVDLVKLESYISASVKFTRRSQLLVTSSISVTIIVLVFLLIIALNQRNIALNSQAIATAGIATQVKALEKEQTALAVSQAESTRSAIVQATSTAIQGVANSNEQKAKQETLLKVSENLSAQAFSIIDTNYTQSLLLGVESYRLLESQGLQQGRYPDIVPDLLSKMPNEIVQTLAFPPPEIVKKAIYSPNGDFLVTISKHFVVLSNKISVWDTRNPSIATRTESWRTSTNSFPTDLTFNPASTIMAIGYDSGSVELWGIRTTEIKLITTINDLFSSKSLVNTKVAVSMDGSLLAVSGNGTVELLDISNPTSPIPKGRIAHPHEGADVTYLWFDPNQKDPFLVSTGEDGTFRVWNLLASAFIPTESQRSILRESGISDIAISSKYVIIATAQTIDIYYSFNTGFMKISSFEYPSVNRGLISSMLINSDSTRLFTSNLNGSVIEWDISNPKNIRMFKTYNGHTNSIKTLAFHPSGKYLVSGGDDSSAIIWDITGQGYSSLEKNKIIGESSFTDVSFAREQNLLALGDTSGDIYLINTTDPISISIKKYIHIKETPISHVTFSPNGEKIALVGGDNKPYRPTYYLYNIKKDNLKHIFESNTSDILMLGNQYILAGEVGDSMLKLFQWDVSGDIIVREYSPLSVNVCPFLDLTFSNNLAAVATCNLQIWDFSDGKPPTKIADLDSPFPNGVAISNDEDLIGVANQNVSFSIWELSASGKYSLVSNLANAHLYGVTSIAISPDKTVLATGGEDQTIILWDITNPQNPSKRVTLYGHSNNIMSGSVFFTEDGKALVSASINEVIIWDIDEKSWINKACKIAGRNFTTQEWGQFVGLTIPYHPTCPDLPIPE